MSKMVLDYDPVSGISHWVSTDEESGITTYGADQNVDAILEANQQIYNADHGRHGEWSWVGCIPMVFFAELVMAGVIDTDGNTIDGDELNKRLKKILNDSDYRKLKTRPGSI
jgi:hypothetical protein